jgi:hypothetical protein
MAWIFVFVLILMILTSSCLAESLVTIDSLIFSPESIALKSRESIEVNGCHISGDTVYATTNVGIFAKYTNGGDWVRIFDCSEYGENWREDRENAQKENKIYNPGLMWYDKIKDRYVIIDKYSQSLFVINNQMSKAGTLQVQRQLDKNSYFNNFCPQEDFFLFGLESGIYDYSVGVVNSDFSDYRRIFKRDPALSQILDSLGADFYPIVAFNERDRRIWVALRHYDIIYIISKRGEIVDSIRIAADDFQLPQPPRSRINSEAVFKDWASRCSTVRGLFYVSPGYLLLQYFTKYLQSGIANVRLSPTLCWTAKGEPVEIEVDKLWRLVQAQPDGRVVFARYIYENDAYVKTIVYITRIEP